MKTEMKKTKKQDRLSARASRVNAIEKIRLEHEWARKRNKQYNRANKPSDFKTYEGRILKHDWGEESSDGEEVLAEVSAFSDSSDDGLLNNVLNYEEEQKY